jgi:hypothetical protein
MDLLISCECRRRGPTHVAHPRRRARADAATDRPTAYTPAIEHNCLNRVKVMPDSSAPMRSGPAPGSSSNGFHAGADCPQGGHDAVEGCDVDGAGDRAGGQHGVLRAADRSVADAGSQSPVRIALRSRLPGYSQRRLSTGRRGRFFLVSDLLSSPPPCDWFLQRRKHPGTSNEQWHN